MAVGLAVVAGGTGLVISRLDDGFVEHQTQPVASDFDAPAFDLAPVRDGEPRVTLPGGGKPIVLNFFASWCEPCKDELPLLQSTAEARAGEFSFVGIAHLDQRDDAREMLDEFGVTYPAGHDPGGETAPRYRLRGLPGTVFIRPDGTIASIKHGQISAGELDRHLAATLHEVTE